MKDNNNGIEFTYHPNGKVMWRKNCLNGELHGECIKYDDDGNIIHNYNYSNGELHGIQIDYYLGNDWSFVCCDVHYKSDIVYNNNSIQFII